MLYSYIPVLTTYYSSAVYFYTSHLAGPQFWARFYGFTEKDRVYVSLPLYHSAATVLGVIVSWVSGATLILARKFSASSFWDDCRRNNVTVIQYIGEICRYLLNNPESPLDKVHSIRLAHGNGMRPDVWNRFRDRFGIPLIGEWYASTEGTGALTNYNTGPQGAGAIGFRGTIARMMDKGLRIVKMDVQTEELIRDKNGWCIEVKARKQTCTRLVMSMKKSCFLTCVFYFIFCILTLTQ